MPRRLSRLLVCEWRARCFRSEQRTCQFFHTLPAWTCRNRQCAGIPIDRRIAALSWDTFRKLQRRLKRITGRWVSQPRRRASSWPPCAWTPDAIRAYRGKSGNRPRCWGTAQG